MTPLFLRQRRILRRLGLDDFQQVSDLVIAEASTLLRQDFTEKAWEEFVDFISPEQLFFRHSSGSVGWVVQDETGGVEAFCEVRSTDASTGETSQHIFSLFVRSTSAGHGLARQLIEVSRKELMPRKQTVFASSYAEGFYEKMGFCPMGDRQQIKGIYCRPMEWHKT